MKRVSSHFSTQGCAVLYKLGLFLFLFGFVCIDNSFSQCTEITAATYVVDFSASKDTSWSVSSKRTEKGCVDGNAGNTCVKFIIKLNPGSDLVNFTTDQNTSASFYSVNCGPTYSVNVPACITGQSTVCITFCKPGNNTELYTVSASSIIKGSGDIILRQNCSGAMSVSGVSAASVNWRSIFPGTSGTYNNYLSATSGVTNVTVTPTTGAPSFIDYEVSGTGACAGLRRDTIRVYTVAPMLLNINPVNPAICNGASVTLTGSVSGGNPPYTYSWNTGSAASSITVSTPASYTLSVSDNTVGCSVVQQVANVVAAPTPAVPTASGVTICSGTSATLTATAPGGSYQWYDAATGGNLLATGTSYNTPILTTNRTYYVQTTVNGCTSARTAVTVTVTAIPAAPTASGATICMGGTASLIATAPGSSFQWYNAASGGTLLASTAAYNTPTLNANTTYYVQAMNGTCSGPRSAVTVVVNPLPASPTAAAITICSGNTGTLVATAPGGTYQWYDAATNGTLLATNASYTSPVLVANTTYYVQTTVNGCTSSSRTPVAITVSPTPAIPNITGTAICGGTSTGLTITSPVSGETYRWYDQSTGGNLLQIGTSYTTPILNATTNYYVSATSSSGCTSNRQTFTLNVTPIQDPVFTYPSSTFCKTDPSTPTPTIDLGVTGTFSGSAGLVIDANSGAIDLAASTASTHTVTLTVSNGSCNYVRSTIINIINTVPNPNFIYGTGQFCVNQANALPTFPTGGTAGVFTSTAGLTFQNSSTGEINFTQTSVGTYTITNTIGGTGGCVAVSSTFVINVAPPPTSNAGANLVGCEGQPISLTGTIGGTASSGVWSIVGSGQGSFTNASQLNTTFTPAIGQSFITLRLTTDDPAGACSAVSDDLTVEVKPTPALPTVSSTPICSGTNTILIATAPGGNYNWYDVASGGVATPGVSFTTPVLSNNTTFYVSVTSSDGCTSGRQPIIVSVKPLPAVISSATGEICSGVNQNYTITSNIVGSTFSWSRSAVVNVTNAVIVGQNSASITEALNSIVTTPVNVVYQIIPTANGCTGSPFNYTVTVKPIPVTPVASSAAVCEGEIIRLSTTERVGASYSWTGPDGFVSNIRLPEIPNANINKQGVYTVRVIENGCQSLPGSVTQTIKTKPAAPVVSNSSPICIGESFSLNTPIVIGATYSWSGPNGFSSAEQMPSITNAQSVNAGNYSLSISVDGCTSIASVTNVVVNLPPAQVDVSSTGPVCISEELRLIAQDLQSASYMWTGPNGFVANSRVAVISNMNNTTTGAYQVIASVAGCASVANSIDATLKPTPAAPAIDPISAVCENETLILNAAFVSGATYNWSGPGGFISNTQSPAITNVPLSATGNYSVNIVVNGCRSANNTVGITVNPIPPAPQVTNNGAICEGNTLQLSAANITGATYSWTGPSGFVSSNQNPVINNALLRNGGTYTAIVSVNGCKGPASSTTAIVNPLPGPVNIVTSGPVCEGRSVRLIADSVTAGSYSWSGPNGFTANTRTVLLSSISNNNNGEYRVAVSVAGCTGVNSSITTTVKPTPTAPIITVPTPICQNSRLNLGASLIPGATYHWTGPNGFDSRSSSPVIDSVRLNQAGIYSVNVTVDGCVSNDRSVNVAVIPEPVKPQINSNSPLCLNDPLQLTATAGVNASFRWFSSNGFNSVQQNPQIASVNYRDSGQYAAFVIINGCVSDTAFTRIEIDQPAVVNAGNDQTVCANNAMVQLNGVVSGGTNTGVWTSSGSGRFGTRISSLANTYIPSAQDTANGIVTLTLSSTNNKSCRVVNSSLLIRITDAPFVDIGNNRVVCANDSLMVVTAQFRNASGIQWSSSGTGTFDMVNGINTNYVLSNRDQSLSSFKVFATTTGNGSCLAVTDELTVNVAPITLVNAGKDLFIFENTPYTLNPQVTGNVQAYQWTPATFLNNATTRNPVFRGNADQNLTLRVTSTNGCIASDEVFITVLKPFPIPNVFSPNGDGIHDTWVIPELDKYPDAVVSVFDRYGRRVFFTEGYKKPWDGTHEGKPVAVATYYYIIEPKLIPGIFSGSVTILK